MIKKIKAWSKIVVRLALNFPIVTLIIFFLLSLSCLYLPFVLHLDSFWGLEYREKFNFASILLNFDGLNYIIAAKTWYIPEQIHRLFPGIAEPAHYFPAHFPLYPAIIWLLAQLPLINYPYAAILVTLELLLGEKKALVLSLIFLVFPARWLVIRAVPSPEPLFLATIIGAIYFFKREHFFKSAVLIIIAQTIKSPGILLAGSLGLVTLAKIHQTC